MAPIKAIFPTNTAATLAAQTPAPGRKSDLPCSASGRQPPAHCDAHASPKAQKTRPGRHASACGNVMRSLLKYDSQNRTRRAEDERSRQFTALCARLEEDISWLAADNPPQGITGPIKKKLIATLLAKSLEQELVSNAKQKKLFETLSLRMQTAASLFVEPQTTAQAQRQQALLKGFFGPQLAFTYAAGHTGAYDPDNGGKSAWFYQYRYFTYDRIGQAGLLAGSKAADKNYLDNSHPFYTMSLVMNLLYAGHRIPVEGHDYLGQPQDASRFEDILTKPYIAGYLRHVNHGARDWTSGPNVARTQHVFGPFIGAAEQAAAMEAGLSAQEAPMEFFHPDGWANGKSNYAPKPDNLYTGPALKKDYFVAAASGTTVGILCAHLRLAELERYLDSDGCEAGGDSARDGVAIDKNVLRDEMLDLTMGLFAWMGLAGDHSLYEVAFSYAFMNLYCQGFMDDHGKLIVAQDHEIAVMIAEVQEQDFITDFLHRVKARHPAVVDRLLECFADTVSTVKPHQAIVTELS